MDPEKVIGARIQDMRKRKGLTVAELARRMSVTMDAVNRLQRGETTKQYVKLIALAETLGVTPNDILGVNATDPSVLLSSMTGAFEGLGLPGDEARILAASVLEAARSRPTQPEGVDDQTSARIRASFAAEQLARPKLS